MKQMFALLVLITATTLGAAPADHTAVRRLIADDANESRRQSNAAILAATETVYGALEEQLSSGGKIRVFFDPAHGKLPGGRWQGEATFRMSATGKPEEHYSIPLSRKLYRLLSANPHFEVISTDDFMAVLREESDTYNNITFTETIRRAEESGCFMIVSSHLNNVSTIHKADGLANIPGIHITMSEGGRRYLTDVTHVQRGFLTLYNKFDPTGFTYAVAAKFRTEMLAQGFRVNNWDRGTVADDRFVYFARFPVSFIFESGFISHPYEEAELLDPKRQDDITLAQYRAITTSLEEYFGIDVSSRSASYSDPGVNMTELIALAKITSARLVEGDMAGAAAACAAMEKTYGKTRAREFVRSYTEMRSRLERSLGAVKRAERLAARKKYSAARRTLIGAHAVLGNNPVYFASRSNIAATYRRLTGRSMRRFNNYGDASNIDYGGSTARGPLPERIERHARTTPFILVIEDGMTLADAVDRSIAPDQSVRNNLIASLHKARQTDYITQRKWSKKKKKYISVSVKKTRPVTFTRGIYVVQFNAKLGVSSAEKVSRVPFDPARYQNQHYFKNSSFAESSRERTL